MFKNLKLKIDFGQAYVLVDYVYIYIKEQNIWKIYFDGSMKDGCIIQHVKKLFCSWCSSIHFVPNFGALDSIDHFFRSSIFVSMMVYCIDSHI